MACSPLVGALAAYHPHLATNNFEKDLQHFDLAAASPSPRSARARRAMIYGRHTAACPVHLKDLPFCDNFLHLVFSRAPRRVCLHPCHAGRPST